MLSLQYMGGKFKYDVVVASPLVLFIEMKHSHVGMAVFVFGGLMHSHK